MNSSQKSRRVFARLVTVTIKAVTVRIKPARIDKSHRAVLHSDYKGQKGNSSAICQIGVLANAAGNMIARTTETHLG